MTHRGSVGVGLVLSAVLALAGASASGGTALPAASRSATHNCRTPRGAIVFVQSKAGIIFEGVGGEGVLCSYVTGRMVRLEATEHFNWPAASFSSYWAAVYSTGNEAPWAVTLYDMRAGKVRFEDNSIGKVDGIVVAAAGALAWLQDNSLEYTSQTTYQVLEHNRRGTVVLDSSPTIRPRSLALRGNTLRWRDGNVEHTQPLR